MAFADTAQAKSERGRRRGLVYSVVCLKTLR